MLFRSQRAFKAAPRAEKPGAGIYPPFTHSALETLGLPGLSSSGKSGSHSPNFKLASNFAIAYIPIPSFPQKRGSRSKCGLSDSSFSALSVESSFAISSLFVS